MSSDQLEWAELILVMEPIHRRRLQRNYGPLLKGKRVGVLAIVDEYEFMQPDLIELLWERVEKYLP